MQVNPFEITKAVDYTDDEINSTFVDYPNGGFNNVASPASPMPQFLVGGKGGGRTHLMRYHSYASQKQRSTDLLATFKSEGHLGIYFRCSGLNADRFNGKNINEDAWKTVFYFYLDVWLTEHLLNVLSDVAQSTSIWNQESQLGFVNDVEEILRPGHSVAGPQVSSISRSTSISDLNQGLSALRREMDRSINNAAIRKELTIEILSNPGILIFATVRAAAKHLTGLNDVIFSFLLDEFENLTQWQQVYVNTLIREKEPPTSFLVGSRSWGVRTQMTLSAGEENKKGSEYEWIDLEMNYRQTGSSYSEFCVSLANQRLARSGYRGLDSKDALRDLFDDNTPSDRFGDDLAINFLRLSRPEDRKHLMRLRVQLMNATGSANLSDDIVNLMSRPDSPVSEKLSIHKLYQQWSKTRTINREMALFASEYVDKIRSGEDTSRSGTNFVNLWRTDLTAQLYVDANLLPPYFGVEKFIDMSGYLPRSFLTTLKYVVRSSLRRGESPFDVGSSVSVEAQLAGVLDASHWFSRDARPRGALGNECDRSVRRLATLFNRVRYSDKPSEVSCVAFSTDLDQASEQTVDILQACVEHSLLIEIEGGRMARNDGPQLHKYKLHPMLAPMYALPTSHRGELHLSVHELKAIFDPSVLEEEYSAAMRRRLATMRAPFAPVRDTAYSTQDGLF